MANCTIHKGLAVSCESCNSPSRHSICGGCHQPFVTSTALHEQLYCSQSCERADSHNHHYARSSRRNDE